MKTMIFIVVALFALSFAHAENILVVGKDAYSVTPKELNKCGEPGDPVYAAAKFAILGATSIGEGIYDSACKANNSKNCTSEERSKFGVEVLFKTIRLYPSRFTSDACKQLRQMCIDTCTKNKSFDNETCLIECNQYETYNR